MFIRTGSLEPVLVLASLLVLGLVAWLLSRRVVNPHQELEPEDASAKLAAAFLIKPYLQLGDRPHLLAAEAVDLFWHSTLVVRTWSVQVRSAGATSWRSCAPVASSAFNVKGIASSIRHRAVLDGLTPGAVFDYRVLADGMIAFSGSGRARNAVDQPYNFAVIGDLGYVRDKREQRMAHQLSVTNPDMLFVAGDIVYERGRVSEYLRDFFPSYNPDQSNPETGGPVLRSVITLGNPGNHDVGLPNAQDSRNFSEHPDLLGYFLFWSQPLNGPLGTVGGANTPNLIGDLASQESFLNKAGDAFPRMANYSFQWGNSYWIVLDSNAYMDWSDPQLLAWLEAELTIAQGSTWLFVSFHHPVFSSDGKHVNEQRMRLLCPLFEKYNVDVVFTGHNHCYERTHPVRFAPYFSKVAINTENCPVPGDFTIDTAYDGITNTHPNGVIYLVDGAGGAKFYPELQPSKSGLKPFTARYDQSVNSFTHCHVDGRKFVARQLSHNGEEIDRFEIAK